jgi:adenylosuccinate synthase
VTRVGAGPLDGELSEQEADARGWTERGTVTGRRRRVAPFNFDLARRAVMLNGATFLAITKLDRLFPECSGQTDFDSLPSKAVDFIKRVENETRIPVHLIGTGPSVEEVIDRRGESDR